MFHFLRITKNRIKALLFFIVIGFITAYLPIYLIAAITKIVGFRKIPELTIILKFLNILRWFVVSYIVIVFLKKEFFFKKYFKELAGLLLVLLVLDKLLMLAYKWSYVAGLFSSDVTQILYFALQFIVYYLVICFLVKE